MKTIKNYGELKEHLLAVMDFADNDKMCKKNNSISKGQFWNILMKCCIDHKDNDEINGLVLKNALTEFPEHLRCDYNE